MKKRKIIISLVIITLTCFFIHPFVFADVGSFDRYDSGSSWSSSDWGSSDWGSSDWSSSDWGSSDWGSSDSGSSDWDFDWDSDSSYGRYSNNNSDNTYTIISIAFLALIIILPIILRHNSSYRRTRPIRDIQYSTPNVDLSQSHLYANKIRQIDPNFSEEKMLEWSKVLFVKLQNAWTARDWEPMRPFESKDLFEQHKNQVQGYIDTNRINVVDRIAVNYASIYRFRQEGDRDILEIALKATKKDYIIDATTKELLEGSKTQDRISLYKMTFERKTGVLTKEGTSETKTTNCPNCGAPTQITSAGKCEYCGSVIITGENNWVLSGLEPLRD